MKKITISTIFLLLFVGTLIIFLSIKGYETDKFNKLLTNEVVKLEKNFKIDLQKVKIKIDFKEFNIFLSTQNPKVLYQNINVPIKEFKIYLNFFSILKAEPKINRSIIKTNYIKIDDLKKLTLTMKPSNLKRFILNNISKGNIQVKIDIFFDDSFNLENYKINGDLNKVNILVTDKLNFEETSFDFIVDNDLVTINSLNSNFKKIPISNGNIKINKKDQFDITGSVNTNLDSSKNNLKDIFSDFINSKVFDNELKVSSNFTNKFDISLSKSLEIKDYNINISGNIDNSNIKFSKPYNPSFLQNKITKLSFNDTELKFNFHKRKLNNLNIIGKYKVNDDKYENYKFKNVFNKNLSNYELSFKFSDKILIESLNYIKEEKKIADISSEFSIKKGEIFISNLKFSEGKNLIYLNDVKLDRNNELKSIKSIKVRTLSNKKENNNFNALFGNKIIIKGSKFDATNLINKINEKKKNNFLKNITKEIEVNFGSVATKKLIPIKKFNLIGKIKDGKFVKINSKGEFSQNQFLDITLKNSNVSKTKVLEIYSDIPSAILADYNFFKGVSEGKLLYVLNYNDNNSTSNLRIDNFKLKNAPGFAKLLTLADFRGAADLLSGEGITFDALEIKMSNSNDILKIEELYAIGPSISILVDGYVENKSGLVSLRGSMVPARELNKLISKIPVIGKILIGREVGEGVFGVSFKLKGKPGKIKTSVNPLKTLTPRFITRALEKRKKKD